MGQLDLVELDEPTRLIDLLADGADPVVLVDAVLDDGPAGRVLLIDLQTPGGHCQRLLSTHGVGVMEAIELARIAHPDGVARRISIVGITVQETSRRGKGLSAAGRGGDTTRRPTSTETGPRQSLTTLLLCERTTRWQPRWADELLRNLDGRVRLLL